MIPFWEHPALRRAWTALLAQVTEANRHGENLDRPGGRARGVVTPSSRVGAAAMSALDLNFGALTRDFETGGNPFNLRLIRRVSGGGGRGVPFSKFAQRSNMPPKTREWIYLPRTADLATLFAAVRDMDCLSVVGVSNLGKSATLRSLTNPKVQAEYLGDAAKDYLFIYIDFNQMLEMSDQAFYELLLRCSLDAMREARVDAGVMRQVETAYTGLVAPSNAFQVPLRFAHACPPSATSCRSVSSFFSTRWTVRWPASTAGFS